MRNGKTNLIYAICAYVVIILLISFVYISNRLNFYTLSPEICKLMGIGEPQLFCETKGEDTPWENGYTHAHVNNDGNLFLVLSDREIKSFKNNDFPLAVLQAILGDDRDIDVDIDLDDDFFGFLENAPTCGLEISNDFTKVTQTPEDNGWYYPFVVPACALMQVFEGIPSDEIKVEYIKVNDTGDILECIVWPPDTFNP